MLRPLLFLYALAASSLASGEPPERIARLSYVLGEVTFRGAQEVAPSALPDRPLDSGDRLTTARDGRAELALGNATLRLDEESEVKLAELGPTVRLELSDGTASLHLYELADDETFEVATLNTTIAFREPGEYRLDITESDATELTVRAGAAEVATAGGPVRVADGQRVRLEGHADFASLVTPRAADDFDDWVLEREVLLAEAAPPPGEFEDEYGEWRDDPSYGEVWMPSYAYGGYDPFAYGYWQRSGFGWSWYDPMPWSGYTSHYGYWAYLDDLNRWAWVSQRRELQRRAARRDEQLDRALDDARSQDEQRDTRPVGRPRTGDVERRAQATSSDLARRLDAERRPVVERETEPAQAPRSHAPSRRSAPATQDSSSPSVRPTRPATSSNSSGRSGSQTASRAAATAAAAKGAFARPQEP